MDDIKFFLKEYWEYIIVILFILALIFLIILEIFPNNSDNSTLNIISLLVQSEAAVIAIIITLSLVAVQLAGSSYSTRVMDIFQRSLSFWTIVMLYVFAIIMGILTLILRDNGLNTFIIQKLILIDYFLGIIAFMALFPFIWITFDLLKPSNVITKLSIRITKDNVLEFINNEKENEDPIQPIIDIIQASILKYDNRTVKDGLDKIDERINSIFSNELSKKDINKIINFMAKHFNRISNLAITKRDEESLCQTVEIFLEKGIFSLKWEYEKCTFKLTTEFIKNIGNLAIEQRMNILAEKIAIYLGKIGEIAIENEDENEDEIESILFLLKNIVTTSIDRNMGEIAKAAAQSVVNIEKSVINNEYKQYEARLILYDLFYFVKMAIIGKNDKLASSLSIQLFEAGKFGIENKISSLKDLMPDYVQEIWKIAVDNRLFITGNYAGECLVELLNLNIKYVDDDTKENSIKYVLEHISNIGKLAENEDNKAKIALSDSLKKITSIIEKSKEKELYHVDSSIKELNKIRNKLKEGLYLEDLDSEDIRKLMAEEVDLDIAKGTLYMSKRLKEGYEDRYTTLLYNAIVDGDSNSFAQSLLDENCLKDIEPSIRSRTGMRKVPWNAHITLAEGEFNRFYVRALCIKAINEGYELEIYRAKQVDRPRAVSQTLIGKIVDPKYLLEDLRKTIGVDIALGIPAGPSSGLSVKINDSILPEKSDDKKRIYMWPKSR